MPVAMGDKEGDAAAAAVEEDGEMPVGGMVFRHEGEDFRAQLLRWGIEEAVKVKADGELEEEGRRLPVGEGALDEFGGEVEGFGEFAVVHGGI